MNIVEPSVTVLSFTPDPELLIERAGRVCYKSEERITDDSHVAFIRMLLAPGKAHESVLEHASASFLIVTDRGISHEIVRHRLASYSQESTRYVSSVSVKDEEVETEHEIVGLYASGLSMRRIAEMSKGRLTEWDVYKVLEANDIERRPLGNTGVVHGDFFDVIDSVEKAYLLGMIQADGSVRKNGSPQISITQHEDYAWYLHRMVTELIRPGAKANKDKRCRQITFTSERLRDALLSKGVVPDKSYSQTAEEVELLWDAIPERLIPSFLRGFLDGDGSIRFFQQKNTGRTDSCNINWTGNPHLLAKIGCWLSDTFGYHATVGTVSGTKRIGRIAVTNPSVGDDLVRSMLVGFIWPYGHPAKTARMIDRVGGDFPNATFGDPRFSVVMPSGIGNDPTMKFLWLKAMDADERTYSEMRFAGAKPQDARAVLPTCLKTEIVMTTNFREWRHFLKLRLSTAAHPDIRVIARMIADRLIRIAPTVFEDFR
jgi:thymidylate synthase ThyX